MTFSRSFFVRPFASFTAGARLLPGLALVAALASAGSLAADPENAVTIPAGSAFQADFAVTGVPPAARSYTITGLPPGLAVTGAGYAAATNTYTVNAPYCPVAGTPTTPGSFALTVTAWPQADAGGAGAPYGYILTVAGQAAAQRVSDAVVTTGHEAMFSAGNTGGSLQWQVSTDNGATWGNVANGTAYSGATGSILTVTGVDAALNGALFRFQANAGGTVTVSNGARLTVAPAFFPFPLGVAPDAGGGLVVSDANTNTVKKISADGAVSLLAGLGGTAGTADGPGGTARFNQPAGLAVVAGSIYVADAANATLRRIAADGTVTTLAGAASSRGGTDGAGPAALFAQPVAVAADAAGNLYVADAMNHTLRKVTPTGVVTTLAGTAGAAGSADGSGAAARFNLPSGVAVRADGTIVVADTVNHTLRTVSPAGMVGTLAGLAGVSGSADGTGAMALFNRPGGLAVDAAGNILVADTANSTIRRVTPAGAVTTLAGLPGVAGLQDGTGSNAFFNQPQGLTLDAAGNLYVLDTGNAAIRKITPGGTVTTLLLTEAPTPPPASTPTTPTQPPVVTPAPAASGGGGGAPSPGFSGLIALLLLTRLLRRQATAGACRAGRAGPAG